MKRSHIAIIAISGTLIAFASLNVGRYSKSVEAKPFRPVCWLDDSREFPNFTPAYWIEREGIKHMPYEQIRLKCRGEIAGHMMDWDADQFWIKRVGVNKVTTR